MLRLLAAVVLAQMALAGPGAHLVRAFGEERHVCACPIDVNGHCRCFDCIRLDVHGDRSAHDHDRDHDDDAPARPMWTSGCTGGPDTPVSTALDPFTEALEHAGPVSVLRALRAPSPPAGSIPDSDLRRLDRPPRGA